VFAGMAPRRSFRDAKIQRLENMASEIAVGLAVLAAAKTEQRLRREAEQRRAEGERRRRGLAARIKHIEDRRIAGLGAILAELNSIRGCSSFI
jgi:anti-sigma factor RsiW